MTLALPRLADSGSMRAMVGAKRRKTGLARRLGGLMFEMSPQVFAVLSLLAGAVMLISAVTPAFEDRLRLLARIAPPVLIDLSHFAASVDESKSLICGGAA